MSRVGDFPFFIDALSLSGFTSLFSGFRLHRETRAVPFVTIANPDPLFGKKASLDFVCNLDLDLYVEERPAGGGVAEGHPSRHGI
jgi:hypothetical protein